MLPSIFGENLFDDFFSDPFEMMMPQSRNPLYGKHAKNLMKTDVRETENSFEVDMDLPGFKKDEVNLELKDGYLTVGRQSPRQGQKGQRGSLHPAGALERLVQQKLLCRRERQARGCPCKV